MKTVQTKLKEVPRLREVSKWMIGQDGGLILDEYVCSVGYDDSRVKIIKGKAEVIILKDYKKTNPELAYIVNRKIEIVPRTSFVIVENYFRRQFRRYTKYVYIYKNGAWYELVS